MYSYVLTGRGTPLEKTLNIIIALYIAILPFNVGPAAWTVLSLTIIFLAFSLWRRQDSDKNSLEDLLKSPVFIAVFLLDFLALVSIPFSPDPVYSTRVFLGEFLLNSVLFFSLVLFCETKQGGEIKWEEALKTANIIFLLAYLGLMIQWVFFPSNPLLIKEELGSVFHS
ncbi:MAG: hypothetical protein DSZ23_04005, partial [Thermodesulfatator sp.]